MDSDTYGESTAPIAATNKVIRTAVVVGAVEVTPFEKGDTDHDPYVPSTPAVPTTE